MIYFPHYTDKWLINKDMDQTVSNTVLLYLISQDALSFILFLLLCLIHVGHRAFVQRIVGLHPVVGVRPLGEALNPDCSRGAGCWLTPGAPKLVVTWIFMCVCASHGEPGGICESYQISPRQWIISLFITAHMLMFYHA